MYLFDLIIIRENWKPRVFRSFERKEILFDEIQPSRNTKIWTISLKVIINTFISILYFIKLEFIYTIR